MRRTSGSLTWGYCYLVTVMDDYSRFILAHMLQRDMTSDSLIEVVQETVEVTGMTDVSIEDRTKLLSDNGSGYVSRAFRDYLQLVGSRHILAAPHHPQTNGKLERYHQTIKRDVNQVVYEVPSELGQEIDRFVEYYNHRHYHKALGNVTLVDVLTGKRETVLQHRKEVQARTLERRKRYNQRNREVANAPIKLSADVRRRLDADVYESRRIRAVERPTVGWTGRVVGDRG